MIKSIPYWRISAFYLFYFASLGAFVPYWSLYLQSKDFDARALAGEALEKMEYSETISEPNGKFFRYIKALPVQPLCLACHGAEAQIDDAVKASLAQSYPHDRATGYALGQVRGAISIKRRAQ